ncbi:hypothetical protein ACDI97_01370 [Xanthomonas axonopodis pv. fascicularis]|uniref:hypothetical protein n=1 Tax=Xanthomonas axonopodis TaxID=53413 RepID=UPI00353140B7
MPLSSHPFARLKAIVLPMVLAAALPAAQQADAAVLARVRVSGTVTGDPRNLQPTDADVYRSLSGAAFQQCFARTNGTRSVSIIRRTTPSSSLSGRWTVTADFACNS